MFCIRGAGFGLDKRDSEEFVNPSGSEGGSPASKNQPLVLLNRALIGVSDTTNRICVALTVAGHTPKVETHIPSTIGTI